MAGAGFIRRYNYFPGTEELTAIEGVVIVDQRSPGPIRGASYGVVCVVGEAANMSYVCKVNTSGEVVSSFRVQEVYGGSDLLDKIGPFDSTLGDFGDECGNLFMELRNKRFSRLVVCPVDLVRPTSTTQYAIRIWRQLPTNNSATDTTPIAPVVATRVDAGAEFRASSNRVLLAAPVDFTGRPPKVVGVDGTTAITGGGWSGGPPATSSTVILTSAGSNFTTAGVAEGDLLVPGSLNAAALSQNRVCAAAGTLRVVSVDSATQITAQKLDGTVFTADTDWAAGSALAFRVHYGTDGDSATSAHQLSEAAGYTVLARPITATVSAATALAAYPTPTAGSGTYWGVTSGLAGITHPTGALTYDANVHAPNLTTTSLLRARYLEALNALLNDDTPTNEISVVTSARKDSTIQSYLRQHCLTSSSRGMSRMTIISPKLTTLTKSTILGSSAPGVGGVGGAVRNERVVYAWPGCRTFIPEMVGTAYDCSDGTTTDDGYIDTSLDTWVAALLSNLQPELNPGQAASPVPEIFSPIIGYQRGCPTLDMNDYILFKQAGICALRMDRVVGPILQSGITTSITPGETNINRRRFADFVQDSLAARYNQMAKMLGRQSIKDSIVSETEAFYADLLADNNPEAQRIDSYSIDDKSPNTPALSARGVWVVKSVCRMLATLDVLVVQSEVGPDAITVTIE
ncbi:MAG: hypothetical protein E6Q97_19550 [Desulfurellales bacterium]|nr:MAG: hypothetical protein E6Q97_19550 [Desulfurellales bacterium]